jgi:hypothetical protein
MGIWIKNFSETTKFLLTKVKISHHCKKMLARTLAKCYNITVIRNVIEPKTAQKWSLDTYPIYCYTQLSNTKSCEPLVKNRHVFLLLGNYVFIMNILKYLEFWYVPIYFVQISNFIFHILNILSMFPIFVSIRCCMCIDLVLNVVQLRSTISFKYIGYTPFYFKYLLFFIITITCGSSGECRPGLTAIQLFEYEFYTHTSKSSNQNSVCIRYDIQSELCIY